MAEVPQGLLPKSAIAAKFPLDMSEVWADEPGDTSMPPSCDFPLAKIENRQVLIEAARSHFKLADEKPGNLSESFPLVALRSDLGLNPQVSAENLKDFVSRHPNSPYLTRLQYFFKQQVSESVKFDIHGTSASLSELDFFDANLQPHSLELPWLLR